jgi:SIR2-like domain/NB-ARC domain
VITTNFDRVLEFVFERAGTPFEDVVPGGRAAVITKALNENRRVLLKLHGDVEESADRVLTRADYRLHYGDLDTDKIKFTLPLPRLLQQVFLNRPLLFLGCSLGDDRTIRVLRHVVKLNPDIYHYANLPLPADEAIAERARFLSKHGIRPIWYPPGPHGPHELLEPLLAYLASVAPANAERFRASGSASTRMSVPRAPRDDVGVLPLPEVFIGREQELTWLEGRLRAGGTTAISAIRGMGGIGKTALAAAALRAMGAEGRFPGGIVVALCDGVRDPDVLSRLILSRFATNDGKTGDAPADTTTLAELGVRIRERLGGRDALMLLDNIEPELDITRVVAPLRAAGVTLLLTARHQLPSVVVPTTASWTLDLLSAEEALHVFAAASGLGGAGELTKTNRSAAKRIVAALDRHTLAVKLAGAYAAELQRSLTALARELETDPLKLPDREVTPRAVALMLAHSVDRPGRLRALAPRCLPAHTPRESADQLARSHNTARLSVTIPSWGRWGQMAPVQRHGDE